MCFGFIRKRIPSQGGFIYYRAGGEKSALPGHASSQTILPPGT